MLKWLPFFLLSQGNPGVCMYTYICLTNKSPFENQTVPSTYNGFYTTSIFDVQKNVQEYSAPTELAM